MRFLPVSLAFYPWWHSFQRVSPTIPDGFSAIVPGPLPSRFCLIRWIFGARGKARRMKLFKARQKSIGWSYAQEVDKIKKRRKEWKIPFFILGADEDEGTDFASPILFRLLLFSFLFSRFLFFFTTEEPRNRAFQGASWFHVLLREMPYSQYIELKEKVSED